MEQVWQQSQQDRQDLRKRNKRHDEHNRNVLISTMTDLHDTIAYDELDRARLALETSLRALDAVTPAEIQSGRTRYEQRTMSTDRAEWVASLEQTVAHAERFVAAMTVGSPDDAHNTDRDRVSDHNLRVFLTSQVLEMSPTRHAHVERQYTVNLQHEILRREAMLRGRHTPHWATTRLAAAGKFVAYYGTATALLVAGNLVLNSTPEAMTNMLQVPPQSARALADYLGAHPGLTEFLKASWFGISLDMTQAMAIMLSPRPGKEKVREVTRLGVKYARMVLPMLLLAPGMSVPMTILVHASIGIATQGTQKTVNFVLDKVLVYEPTGEELELLACEAEAQRALLREQKMQILLAELAAEEQARVTPPGMFTRAARALNNKVPMEKIKTFLGANAAMIAAFAVGVGVMSYVMDTGFVENAMGMLTGDNLVRSIVEQMADGFVRTTVTPMIVNRLGWLAVAMLINVFGWLHLRGPAQRLGRFTDEQLSRLTGREVAFTQGVAEIATFCYAQLLSATSAVAGPRHAYRDTVRLLESGSLQHAVRAARLVAENTYATMKIDLAHTVRLGASGIDAPMPLTVDTSGLSRLLDMRFMMPAMAVAVEGPKVGDVLSGEKGGTWRFDGDSVRDLATDRQIPLADFLASNHVLSVDIALRGTTRVAAGASRTVGQRLIDAATGKHYIVGTDVVPANAVLHTPDRPEWYAFDRALRVPAIFVSNLDQMFPDMAPDALGLIQKYAASSDTVAQAVSKIVRDVARVDRDAKQVALMAEQLQGKATADEASNRKQLGLLEAMSAFGSALGGQLPTSLQARNQILNNNIGNPSKMRALAGEFGVGKEFERFASAWTADMRAQRVYTCYMNIADATNPAVLDHIKPVPGEDGADPFCFAQPMIMTGTVIDELPGQRAAFDAILERRAALVDAAADFFPKLASADHARVAAQKAAAEAAIAEARGKADQMMDRLVATLRAVEKRADGTDAASTAAAAAAAEAPVRRIADEFAREATRASERNHSMQQELRQSLEARSGQRAQSERMQREAVREPVMERPQQTWAQRQAGLTAQHMQTVSQFQTHHMSLMGNALLQSQSQSLAFMMTMAQAFQAGAQVSTRDLDALAEAIQNADLQSGAAAMLSRKSTKVDMAKCNELFEKVTMGEDGQVVYTDGSGPISEADRQCFSAPFITMFMRAVMSGSGLLSTLICDKAIAWYAGPTAFLLSGICRSSVAVIHAAALLLVATVITQMANACISDNDCGRNETEGTCRAQANCQWRPNQCGGRYSATSCAMARMISMAMCSVMAGFPASGGVDALGIMSTLMCATKKQDILMRPQEVIDAGLRAAVRPEILQFLSDINDPDYTIGPQDALRLWEVFTTMLSREGLDALATLFVGNKYSALRGQWDAFTSQANGAEGVARALASFAADFQGAASAEMYTFANFVAKIALKKATGRPAGPPNGPPDAPDGPPSGDTEKKAKETVKPQHRDADPVPEPEPPRQNNLFQMVLDMWTAFSKRSNAT